MAVLRHYDPAIHDLYLYETPARQGGPPVAPYGYNPDCQSAAGIDWTGVRCVERHYWRMFSASAAIVIPHQPASVNFWNAGIYGAVLISPRHAVICQHFRGPYADPLVNTAGIRFLGKGGRMHEGVVTKVYLSVGPDMSLLEFAEPFSEADLYINNRIADPAYIPAGTRLWTKDSNGKVYSTVHRHAFEYPPGVVNGYSFAPLIDGCNEGPYANGNIGIFTGDSGSPTMVLDSWGEQVFVGLTYGGTCINEQTFSKLSEILYPFGYTISHVKLSAKREDLNQDGTVDAADLSFLMSMWGSHNPLYDLNQDGKVDGADMTRLLAAWGSYAPPKNMGI